MKIKLFPQFNAILSGPFLFSKETCTECSIWLFLSVILCSSVGKVFVTQIH